MNLVMLLKLGNLICARADLASFIWKILDKCSEEEIDACIQKYIYVYEHHNRFFPFALRCTYFFFI